MCCNDNLAPEHSPPMSTPVASGSTLGAWGVRLWLPVPPLPLGILKVGRGGHPPHLPHLSCDILVLAQDPEDR